MKRDDSIKGFFCSKVVLLSAFVVLLGSNEGLSFADHPIREWNLRGVGHSVPNGGGGNDVPTPTVPRFNQIFELADEANYTVHGTIAMKPLFQGEAVIEGSEEILVPYLEMDSQSHSSLAQSQYLLTGFEPNWNLEDWNGVPAKIYCKAHHRVMFHGSVPHLVIWLEVLSMERDTLPDLLLEYL